MTTTRRWSPRSTRSTDTTRPRRPRQPGRRRELHLIADDLDRSATGFNRSCSGVGVIAGGTAHQRPLAKRYSPPPGEESRRRVQGRPAALEDAAVHWRRAGARTCRGVRRSPPPDGDPSSVRKRSPTLATTMTAPTSSATRMPGRRSTVGGIARRAAGNGHGALRGECWGRRWMATRTASREADDNGPGPSWNQARSRGLEKSSSSVITAGTPHRTAPGRRPRGPPGTSPVARCRRDLTVPSGIPASPSAKRSTGRSTRSGRRG